MTTAIFQDVSKRAIDKIFDGILNSMAAGKRRRQASERLEKGLAAHQSRIDTWSSRVNVFGYGVGRSDSIDLTTLPLDLSDIPRQFRPSGAARLRNLGEEDILGDSRSLLIVGDPGSGKTTTVKRLVQRILTEAPRSNDEPLTVLALPLRDYGQPSSISQILLSELYIHEELMLALARLNDGPESMVESMLLDPQIERRRLISLAIASLLDELGACLIIDGLDEVQHSAEIFSELEEIVGLLRGRGRIVATCRAGYFERAICGFTSLELCGLTDSQIEEMVKRYLRSDASGFLTHLDGAMRELATTPLFLMQMMIVFDKTGQPMDRPSRLCRSLIGLAIREWDLQRGVRRTTKYADFDTESKIQFLGHLAYELLIVDGKKVFTHQQLRDTYGSIHRLFRLPADEADAVAREIESHSGILVSSGSGFEFSHLQLQEYLAADHLVRSLGGEGVPEQALLKSPAACAGAIALAGNPTIALKQTVGKILLIQASSGRAPQVGAFFERLLAERPVIADVAEHLAQQCIRTIIGDESEVALLHAIDIDGLGEAIRRVISYHGRWIVRTDGSFDLACLGLTLTVSPETKSRVDR